MKRIRKKRVLKTERVGVKGKKSPFVTLVRYEREIQWCATAICLIIGPIGWATIAVAWILEAREERGKTWKKKKSTMKK